MLKMKNIINVVSCTLLKWTGFKIFNKNEQSNPPSIPKKQEKKTSLKMILL